MFSVYKNPGTFKIDGPVTNSVEIRYPVHSITVNDVSESDPYWSASFQGKGNEPDVIYSKDLPQKFYSRKIYIYGKRLHELPVDYDAELVVENVSDTTDQILYTVFLLKTSNIAPNSIDAILHAKPANLDINELLDLSDLVKTVVYEEPDKRTVVMILTKPIPIQSEFITRNTKPETPFTLFPKTYSIANARGRTVQDGQEGFDAVNVQFEMAAPQGGSQVVNVNRMSMDASNIDLECTIDHEENPVNLVTTIDIKKSRDSVIFFAIAAGFFLVISTIIITPYMYFSMKCLFEKPESKWKELIQLIPYYNFNTIGGMFAWFITLCINSPFWLLIFFKKTAATWGNFILIWIFWVTGVVLLVYGGIKVNTAIIIIGSMLLTLLGTAMFSINHYSGIMNKSSTP